MIDSKKINLITIVLVIFALILATCSMLKNSEVSNVGVRTYAEGDEAVLDADDFYTDDAFGVTKINLDNPNSSGNVIVSDNISIMSGGTYVLSGNYNGSINIDTTDNKTVRLVLNNANITSSDAPAIYVNNAGKVVISTAESTKNTISDGDSRLDEELNAAIYSKDTLTLNGLGWLTVNANYADAIKGNDALKITSGNINITSADDGINSNDYIVFDGGNIKVDANGDAVKSGNDEKKGFIAIDGGGIELASGDDALHAEGTLYANGGVVNVTKSVEGFEGYAVVINGGEHTIVSSDDAINAAATGSGDMRNERNHTNTVLTINGGKLHIESGGDGLDSNGATIVNGGIVEVYGPENNGNSSMDFDSTFTINGGVITIAGSSGMAEPPSENSTQNTIVIATTENYDKDSVVSLFDENGNNVIEFASPKRFSWICISSPNIVTGGKYSLHINGNNVEEIEVTSMVTTVGNSGFGMGGFRGFGGDRPGGMGGGRMPQNGERPQMPEWDGNTMPDGERPPMLQDGEKEKMNNQQNREFIPFDGYMPQKGDRKENDVTPPNMKMPPMDMMPPNGMDRTSNMSTESKSNVSNPFLVVTVSLSVLAVGMAFVILYKRKRF